MDGISGLPEQKSLGPSINRPEHPSNNVLSSTTSQDEVLNSSALALHNDQSGSQDQSKSVLASHNYLFPQAEWYSLTTECPPPLEPDLTHCSSDPGNLRAALDKPRWPL